MRFLLRHRSDVAASASPYRVMEQDGGEIAWANRFLDMQRVRGLNELSLRAYGHQLLHFIRWWTQQPGVDGMRLDPHAFTEATLIDYVRAQREELPMAGRRCCGVCSDFTSRSRCRMVLTGCNASGGHRPAGAAEPAAPRLRICG